MSQQDASATRPYRGLVLDTRGKMKKVKNLCILQRSVVTFLGVVGKAVTVCFLLR